MTDLIARDNRELEIRVLRYNPMDPSSSPAFQSYFLQEAESMTLFIALTEIRAA